MLRADAASRSPSNSGRLPRQEQCEESGMKSVHVWVLMSDVVIRRTWGSDLASISRDAITQQQANERCRTHTQVRQASDTGGAR
jgi:hypothetical protein